MAPPPRKTTSPKTILISPYGFGLNVLHLSLIPPLFYFISKSLEGIFFPPQPFAPFQASRSNFLRPTPPSVPSLTETEETFTFIDHNWTLEGAKALSAFLLAILVCTYARVSEAKWNRTSAKANWAYHLERMKRSSDYLSNDNDPYNIGREWNAAIPDMVPSHNEYRISQRREASKLIFCVMISACLCPIAEYFFRARETVSGRLYTHMQEQISFGETQGAYMYLPVEVFMTYMCLVVRYGTLPCFLISLASGLLMERIFTDWEEDAAVGFWDRRIEKWIKTHQTKIAETETKWMNETMFIRETAGGGLESYIPPAFRQPPFTD